MTSYVPGAGEALTLTSGDLMRLGLPAYIT